MSITQTPKNKDQQFIMDLLGFVHFVLQNPEFEKTSDSYSKIATNIAHDLNEWYLNRREKWFSPRTSGYAKYIN